MFSTAFKPTKLASLSLANAIVMAPMTRSRALNGIPNELMAEYYRQRATAGLIIAEGTSPSPNGLGYARTPGLYTPAQVAGWKRVTEAVHAQGGRIFVQLMHTGRIFHPLNLPAGAEGVAPSAVAAAGQMWTDQQQLQDQPTPRALTTTEVQVTVQEYAQAAHLALEAGFDGVELHGANGYLPEQFLNPASNQRTDAYGGSVANRARFMLETIRAIATAVGAARTGIRLSPWGTFNDQPNYPEIDETYAYLAQELQKMGLAYLHLVNPSYLGAAAARTVQTIRQHFTGALILNGGLATVEAIDEALNSGLADLVSLGRPYISNPDLVARLQHQVPLAPSDPATYYAPGPGGFADGYTNYPAAKREELSIG
ncbi:alkene reductase [Hymenobacter sp. YC55]|uniref:alkene reductase n=1 Tax=Hymenobacter sp. YC55 TaxID=3034019 RepID=UPI0023F7D5DB|nr:alkene reductase [Hymenobacter sp. YC55]MDF7813881.1 alkene reductase [Hymenobacter sp. YC55]